MKTSQTRGMRVNLKTGLTVMIVIIFSGIPLYIDADCFPDLVGGSIHWLCLG